MSTSPSQYYTPMFALPASSVTPTSAGGGGGGGGAQPAHMPPLPHGTSMPSLPMSSLPPAAATSAHAHPYSISTSQPQMPAAATQWAAPVMQQVPDTELMSFQRVRSFSIAAHVQPMFMFTFL